jgi:hypothetical protein
MSLATEGRWSGPVNGASIDGVDMWDALLATDTATATGAATVTATDTDAVTDSSIDLKSKSKGDQVSTVSPRTEIIHYVNAKGEFSIQQGNWKVG